jgi:hypothetical protein
MTYEQVAIERWFATNNTSPLTGLPVDAALIPNIQLKRQLAVDIYPFHLRLATNADSAGSKLEEAGGSSSTAEAARQRQRRRQQQQQQR